VPDAASSSKRVAWKISVNAAWPTCFPAIQNGIENAA
jgi:hypothetical protein